jgi:hypothetical protein
MKILLLSLFLLFSASVQAEITCDEFAEQIVASLNQVDHVWMALEQRKRLYMSTTGRLFPDKEERRKKDYERYAVIYNNMAIVHNQQVELYRQNCK